MNNNNTQNKFVAARNFVGTVIRPEVSSVVAPIDIDVMVLDVAKLIQLQAVLPERYVAGVDMWGKPTKRGVKRCINTKLEEAKTELLLTAGPEAVEKALAVGDDAVLEMLEDEDDMNKNRDVDDIASRMLNFEKEEADFAFKSHVSDVRRVWGAADGAQLRHERMAMRLAVLEKLRSSEQMHLAEHLNDSLIERLMNKEAEFDKVLAPFVVDSTAVRTKEVEILRKENNTFWRKHLEQKAHVLRDMSYRAECMMRGGVDGTKLDQDYVDMVIKLATKTAAFCKKKVEEKRTRPYSGRTLNALYNEAIHCLTALGVYKVAFTKKEFGKPEVECSFFVEETAASMVSVKTGSDWTEELLACYYEASDGCSRTGIRGSDS